MARPVAPAATILPAVYALSLSSLLLWLVVFVFTIIGLSEPFYTQPESISGVGTLSLCFGLTSMTCCAISADALSNLCAVSTAVYADQAKFVCDPGQLSCLALTAGYAAGVSLGSAAIALFVLSLATTLLAAIAAAILVAHARNWLTPSSLSVILTNSLLRTGAGVLSFVLTGSGAGLGANAASVVSTAIYNSNNGASLGVGTAGAGLGLSAFACLFAFIAVVLDAVVACGCCCARVSPSGGVIDFSGAGAVVVPNAASFATRSADARPPAK